LKEFLSQKGIAYDDRDVTANRQYADELSNKYGYRSVPVTISGDKVVVGFDPQKLETTLQ